LAVCVHEVIFRSEGLESLQDVGVPLCNPCHEWAHQKNKIGRQQELLQLRNEALKRYATQ